MIATAIAVSGLTLALNVIGAPASHLPATHQQGEVTCLSGGIGLTQAHTIKHAAKGYPLELEFVLNAKPKDEFLVTKCVPIY